jgi:uncharacterized protein
MSHHRLTRRPSFRRTASAVTVALTSLLSACGLGNDARLTGTVSIGESPTVASSERVVRPTDGGGSVDSIVGDVGGSRRGHDTDDVGNGSSPALRLRDEWASERPVDETGATQWWSMEDFMYYVLVELDQYWSSVFAEIGLPEPWVRFWFPAPGEFGTSACTDGSGRPAPIDDRSLFYCPVSENIVVSQQAAYDIWTGAMVGPDGQQAGGMIGDFAVAMVIAHEFGHHIQDELGLFGAFDTPTIEQHADCLAGVWTAAAERIGILDPGDVEEGMTAAWLVGDSAFHAADHHGTSDQRVAAFVAGYTGAAPAACDVYIPSGLA